MLTSVLSESAKAWEWGIARCTWGVARCTRDVGWPNCSQKGSKMEPRVAKWEPRRAKWEPKVSQNRSQNSPPGRLRPTAGACWPWKCLRVTFPHAPFPRSRSGFCSILFFSRRIPSWIPPFPSLVGRFLATFWQHFAHFWLKVGCRVFVMFFWDCFWTIFDAFLTSFGG